MPPAAEGLTSPVLLLLPPEPMLLAPLKPVLSHSPTLPPPAQGWLCAICRVGWLWEQHMGAAQLSSSLQLVGCSDSSRQHAGLEATLLPVPSCSSLKPVCMNLLIAPHCHLCGISATPTEKTFLCCFRTPRRASLVPHCMRSPSRCLAAHSQSSCFAPCCE